MSIVSGRIKSLNAQLDHITASQTIDLPPEETSSYIPVLLSSIKRISRVAQRGHVYPTKKVLNILLEVDRAKKESNQSALDNPHTKELEWLLVAKASVVVYGLTLHQLFVRTLPLSEDIFYWEDVLAVPVWSILYLIQTSPYRFVRFGIETCRDTYQLIHQTHSEFSLGTLRRSLFNRDLFQRVAFSASIPNTLDIFVDPSTFSLRSLYRHEVEAKLRKLKGLKEVQAVALGLLVTDTMYFKDLKWKEHIASGAGMIRHVLDYVETMSCALEEGGQLPDDFEEASTPSTIHLGLSVDETFQNLLIILSDSLPLHDRETNRMATDHGRPPFLTRWWPFAAIFSVSGSTIFNLLVSRRVEIARYIFDMVSTITDFWQNWVVEPFVGIIKTIRHADDSEIALLGRQSLHADMQSLERMVVDFAKDEPKYIDQTILVNNSPTEAWEIIRAGVKEGDVSPVLRAYESDLRSPIKNALTGTLVRALLIQIQKTKVDVEVALYGIDRLLNSQQLVFGFVGLTPSVLLLWAGGRWILALWQRRMGIRRGMVGSEIRKSLRSVERLLDTASGGNENFKVLGYKDRGLLLCEVYLLREFVGGLPRAIRSSFTEDLRDLEDCDGGVVKQLRVVNRIWRIWEKYLQ